MTTYISGPNGTIAVTGTLTGTATGISAGTYYIRNVRTLYKRYRSWRGSRTVPVGSTFQISATEDGAIITLGAGTTTGLSFEYSSLTQPRYMLNGAFQTSEQPQDILRKMLTACGGKLTYQGGKWTLKVAKFYSPTITLTEDDVVGQISVQASQSRRDIFNAVKGSLLRARLRLINRFHSLRSRTQPMRPKTGNRFGRMFSFLSQPRRQLANGFPALILRELGNRLRSIYRATLRTHSRWLPATWLI